VSANIVVPQLGESVVEARVARWLKQPGEAVGAGEPLVELETEKIDLEVGAEQHGVLAEITRPEGDDVKVGEVLGVIRIGDVAEHVPSTPRAELPASATASAGGDTGAPPVTGSQPEAALAARDRATPAARKVAEQHAVDLSQVAPSGEAGRVVKRDVESFVARAAAPAPATSAGEVAPPRVAPPLAPAVGDRREERVRMSKRRATIARNLVEAQRTAAMLTTFNEIDMSEVMALRERRKEAFRKRHGVGLGIASFFVKASVGALKAFPRINAEIQGDEMVLKHYYDIGVAVGAAQGLVVPVLRDAEHTSFAGIESAIRDFARRASDGTLTLEDLRGGTFTITNGGVFGSMLSTPILNPPQVGILGLHKIEDRPIATGGQVVIRPMMYVALTYDHRIVDGMEAVQFLVKVKEFIEDPGHLLLEG
jgi:2-oxoglutarate dehydrogenase E2 component (dihydrolipoamide succinyltransferase)